MNMPYRPGVSQNLTLGSASVASTVVGGTITKVRLVSTGACHVAFGAAPVATATSMLIPANFPEYFLLRPGEKVAVIQDGTATGTLNITPLTL